MFAFLQQVVSNAPQAGRGFGLQAEGSRHSAFQAIAFCGRAAGGGEPLSFSLESERTPRMRRCNLGTICFF